MILSTYEHENKTANVCKQGSEYVIMFYTDGNYIKSELALNETEADDIADRWVFNEIKS